MSSAPNNKTKELSPALEALLRKSPLSTEIRELFRLLLNTNADNKILTSAIEKILSNTNTKTSSNENNIIKKSALMVIEGLISKHGSEDGSDSLSKEIELAIKTLFFKKHPTEAAHIAIGGTIKKLFANCDDNKAVTLGVLLALTQTANEPNKDWLADVNLIAEAAKLLESKDHSNKWAVNEFATVIRKTLEKYSHKLGDFIIRPAGRRTEANLEEPILTTATENSYKG